MYVVPSLITRDLYYHALIPTPPDPHIGQPRDEIGKLDGYLMVERQFDYLASRRCIWWGKCHEVCHVTSQVLVLNG